MRLVVAKAGNSKSRLAAVVYVTLEPAAAVCTVPSGYLTPPVVLWIVPPTVSLSAVLAVPIPTLPLVGAKVMLLFPI